MQNLNETKKENFTTRSMYFVVFLLLQGSKKKNTEKKKSMNDLWSTFHGRMFLATICLVSAKKNNGRHFRSGIKMDGIKKSMSKWSFPLLFSSRFNCNRITMVQSKKSFKLDDGYKQPFI